MGVTIMNNENEERARIKFLKFLDGKLNIKLEWPNMCVCVCVCTHLLPNPGLGW